MGIRVTKYTFPNGGRIFSDASPGGKAARFSAPWMGARQSMPMTRKDAANALRDARRQRLPLSRVSWMAGA